MTMRMDSGRNIGYSLNTGFFDTEAGMDIEIYGEVSNIQDVMETIGLSSIGDGLLNIKKSAASLKGIVIVGVAVYIGWAYYAFFLLTQSIGADAGS